MKFLSYYPATIAIDDPDTGAIQQVGIRVHRFTLPEWSKFSRDYLRSANPPSDILVSRTDAADEQEKQTITIGTEDKEVFVLADDAIKARRLAEMSVEDRATYDAMCDAEEIFSNAFVTGVVTNYITVEKAAGLVDEIEEADGTVKTVPVTTGAQMLKIFGGRQDVLAQLLRAVRIENTFASPLKKVLKSRIDSARSSVERNPEADGPKPAETAGSAASVPSVETADASASPAPIPSGSGQAG